MILPRDMRLRLLGGLAALLLIAPLSRPGPAFAALALVLAAFALARQPLPWRRLWHLEAFLILLLLMLPFTLPGRPLLHLGPLTATAEGLTRALVLSAKVAASVLLLTLLFAATPPERLAAAFRALHLPEPLVRIFLGVLRYLSLIRAEMQRLQDAMRLRSFRPGSNRHTWRSYGHLIGMMLLRAMHRADRVEEAMRLRSYSGRLLAEPLPPLSRTDLLAGAVLPAATAALLLWDKV